MPNKLWPLLPIALLFVGLLPPLHAQQNLPPGLIQYPELIVFNGKIVTMDDAGVMVTALSKVEWAARSVSRRAALIFGKGIEL